MNMYGTYSGKPRITGLPPAGPSPRSGGGSLTGSDLEQPARDINLIPRPHAGCTSLVAARTDFPERGLGPLVELDDPRLA